VMWQIPHSGVSTLALWWGLCVQIIPRAMMVVVYATGKASDAGLVTGDNPDKKGYSGPPSWGLSVGRYNPPRKILNC
jgi:hypothetical protein